MLSRGAVPLLRDDPVLYDASGSSVAGSVRSSGELPRWNFGRLLGVYVVLFFLCAQVIAKLKFGQAPSIPVVAGGALITAGGLIIAAFGP